jgi:hypothetical protein
MRILHVAAVTGIVLLLLAAGSAASAEERGQTSRGEPYLMGGIGLDEVESMQAERPHFSLWLRTATRGSGEYLADVRVRIEDAGGNVVFDQPLSGPWLLVALRPGTYRVEASAGEARQGRKVTIHSRGGREVVFYFDAAD